MEALNCDTVCLLAIPGDCTLPNRTEFITSISSQTHSHLTKCVHSHSPGRRPAYYRSERAL